MATGRLYNEAGAEIEQSTFTSTGTTSNAQPALYTVNQDVYEDKPMPGTSKKARVLKFHQGQVITQAQVDEAYAEATVTSITPTSGPAAGGTSVTATGTNLDYVRGVTVGGAAATNVTVVSSTSVTFVTPAGTVGAKDVVFDLAAGDVTLTGGFTYA